MIVDLDELQRALTYLSEINNCDLKQISWVRNGEECRVFESELDEYKCIGMNNVHFASHYKNWVEP